MPRLQESVATLRISGDNLVPEEISRLLGSDPTHSQIKGEIIVGPKTGKESVAKSGFWLLGASDCEPENINGQVEAILGMLTDDLNVWTKIGQEFEIDLFCGLFLGSSNEGLSISPKTLTALGQRSIELALDIYYADEDADTVP
jgi:hypothetical protein